MPTQYDTPAYVDPQIFVCPTLINLRLVQGQTPLPTSALSGNSQSYSLAVLLGGGAAFDGTDGLYAWNEVSTTNDNNGTVIKPTAIGAGNPGRWIQIV